MAENVNVTEGVGKVIATDEVTRNVLEQQQIIKISLGAENEFDTLVDSGPQTAANSVPIVRSADATSFETLVTYAFGSITGAFTEVLNPAGNLKYIEMQNDTNANLIVSFDGGTTEHWRIPLKEPRIFDVGIYGHFVTTSIRVKHDGTAATEGNLFVMGW